jgi:hypothetical protein
MTEPRTEAGRRLLDLLYNEDDDVTFTAGQVIDIVVAIEEEARAESWAIQPNLVLDVDRLGQVIYEMGIDDLDLPDAHKLAAHIVTRLGEPTDE